MFEIFCNMTLGRKIHVALATEEQRCSLSSQTGKTTEYNDVGLLSPHCSLSTFCVLSHLCSQPPVKYHPPHFIDGTAKAQKA